MPDSTLQPWHRQQARNFDSSTMMGGSLAIWQGTVCRTRPPPWKNYHWQVPEERGGNGVTGDGAIFYFYSFSPSRPVASLNHAFSAK